MMSCSPICIKRQMTRGEISDQEMKKPRSEVISGYCDQFLNSDCSKPVTCLEDLSNELFYEIFEYLDGYDIVNVFSDLNTRFNHLVNDSSVQFKSYRLESFDQLMMNHFYEFILPNSHRVRALHIYDVFYALCLSSSLNIIDKSFYRLEGLVLHSVSFNCLMQLLPNLIILPQLYSLKITPNQYLRDYTQLYALIVLLPSLKYNKLSVSHHFLGITMPTNISYFSPIEHLNLDHTCYIHVLASILPYTPSLTRLSCLELVSEPLSNWTQPITLCHLTHISINTSSIPFKAFKVYFKNSLHNIRCLRFLRVHDMSYFDAHGWEALIRQHMPNLRILDLKHLENVLGYPALELSHLRLHRFDSSFWSERRWFLQVHIQIHTFQFSTNTYAIQTLKKPWSPFQDHVEEKTDSNRSHSMAGENRSSASVPLLELIIENAHLFESYSESKDYNYRMISLIPFTSLRLTLSQFSISILLQLLELLPHLDTLTIASTYPQRTKILSKTQLNKIRSLSASNKITRLNLEQMTELDQVHLLMDMCPHMQYLQVNCRNRMDVEWLVRYVFKKRNTNFISNLHALCLQLSEEDDEIIRHLRTIIDTEKLVDNYTIKRAYDRIYLQWNAHPQC